MKRNTYAETVYITLLTRLPYSSFDLKEILKVPDRKCYGVSFKARESTAQRLLRKTCRGEQT